MTDTATRQRHPGRAAFRTPIFVLACLLLLPVIGFVGYSSLLDAAWNRCTATPPGGSVTDFPAWEAEGTSVSVGGDGFACEYTMKDGRRTQLRLGWLP
jgi:hypothetical protein